MHTNLIILAGGASSRMKKQTTGNNLSVQEIAEANQRSKSLISLTPDGRPILDYLLYNAKQAGYKNIYIVVGKQSELFKKFYGSKEKNNDFHGLNVSFATQHIPKERTKPFGTADAVYQAVMQYPALNTYSYTVCNSDNLYTTEAFLALRKTTSDHAFIAYNRDALEFSTKRVAHFALAKLNPENQLVDIIEKPELAAVDGYKDASGVLRVSMNIFKFKGSTFLKYLKNCPIHVTRNEKELPTALLNMIKEHPNTVVGIPFSEHVPDLTAKDDIAIVKNYLAKHYKTLDWNLA
ncbi:sugar phosphate nucleotidyltransferase [Kordia sp.]|uniref:sugar phosphate nucleotidyltransferase n=1 Tax=Kordia sp. TaxID=1965332 RepID=UPI0025C6E0D5|nr:sugar phosphate nucleotidyltransferase [Kordia sp.]MCH2193644.1 NTP transferase domain-containing protein [Kordia sp.]